MEQEQAAVAGSIVCLGWGSLIWCQKALPVRGDWHADGPELPVEFARTSQDGRVTLVICEGAPTCPTLWAGLGVERIDEAKSSLALRERVKPKNIKRGIGYWTAQGASGGEGSAAIAAWAQARGLAGVVWTALRPKFGDSDRTPSEAEVVAYLSGLNGPTRDAAEEYVRLAPQQIVTPYRTAIAEELGWTYSGRNGSR